MIFAWSDVLLFVFFSITAQKIEKLQLKEVNQNAHM